MRDTRTEVESAVAAIRQRWNTRPTVGVILGSGLGDLADHVDREADIPYSEIPHLVNSTAIGHRGRLVCGRVLNRSLVVMQGRCHLYEGCSVHRVTLPIRVMKSLGVEVLIVSNACGGLNPYYRVGDVVAIEDHINLMFRIPGPLELDGGNVQQAGLRRPYDPVLIEVSLAIARACGFAMHRGIYAGVLGPNYETRAELRMLRRIGVDAVGMSTIPEVIVGVQEGLRIVGLSVVTNECRPDAPTLTTGEAVIASATSTQPKIRELVFGLIEHLSKSAVHVVSR
jgi:purine-nucleoside phosphorylase